MRRQLQPQSPIRAAMRSAVEFLSANCRKRRSDLPMICTDKSDDSRGSHRPLVTKYSHARNGEHEQICFYERTRLLCRDFRYFSKQHDTPQYLASETVRAF